MQKGHFVTNFHAKERCSFPQPYFACATWSRWWLEPSLLSILFKNQTTWAREGEDTIPALVITCLLTERLWKISCSWLREVPTFCGSEKRKQWEKKRCWRGLRCFPYDFPRVLWERARSDKTKNKGTKISKKSHSKRLKVSLRNINGSRPASHREAKFGVEICLGVICYPPIGYF